MSVRRFACRDGFTLAEILVAMAVIAVGLVGLAVALQHGLSGIETGRGESVAIFLVEDKLEELKALALVDWTNLALQPGTTTDYCQPSSAGCSATATPASFRRTTTVTTGTGGTCTAQCKLVTVVVVYRPITVMGQLDQERRVEVGALFVSRA
jgi:prepilin-type N-terminal cleavage/methylation domain-containing protein